LFYDLELLPLVMKTSLFILDLVPYNGEIIFA